MKALVIASTYQQYKIWLQETGRRIENYIYVSRTEHLYGYDRDTSVIIVGPNLNWQSTDYRRLEMEAGARFDNISYERT